MRARDIVLGESYRLKKSPDYGYIKALEIIPAKQGINSTNYIAVKCEHTVNKNDTLGFIRYFKPSSIIKIKENLNKDL